MITHLISIRATQITIPSIRVNYLVLNWRNKSAFLTDSRMTLQCDRHIEQSAVYCLEIAYIRKPLRTIAKAAIHCHLVIALFG
jgi:hypothetical protein